jgi:uncharacterized membrane protein HdeD (DUF308 family)
MFTDDIGSVHRRTRWALVVRGLVGIALGIFIFARPLESVAALALVIALWALIDGIVSIVHAFDLRRIAPHWWVMLLAGLVSIVFGIAALYYYPVLSLAFAVVWSAWWLISGGVLGLYVAVRERKATLAWGWTMTWGIVGIAVGVLALMYPGITLAALMGVLAAFGIVGGIVMLVGAGTIQSFEQDATRAVHSPSRA